MINFLTGSAEGDKELGNIIIKSVTFSLILVGVLTYSSRKIIEWINRKFR